MKESTRRNVFEESSESEVISGSELYNDDELDDLESDENELGVIWGEGSIETRFVHFIEFSIIRFGLVFNHRVMYLCHFK